MPRSILLSAAVLASSVMDSSAVLAAFTTSATYDATTNANVVDAFVLGAGETYLGYTNAFLAAHGADTGGVINFDSQTISSTSVTDTTLSATFGSGGIHTLSMTGSTYNFQTAGVVGTPISGSGGNGGYMRVTDASGLQTYNFNSFQLSMVGFTVLSRTDAARTITATVILDDNTTIVRPAETVASGGGTDDTFFGFTAPVGRTIKTLTINGGAGSFFAIDDLAFVAVIPEPSGMALGALAAAGFLVRRRRVA